jgi:UTP--glucose-1-phosphate uridylyltransferase
MQIRKAVITTAGKQQRSLPMQMLLDEQGQQRPVLSMIVREALGAGVSQIGIVVWPGDEEAYAKLLPADAGAVTFIPQPDARGYANAIFCARDFIQNESFLHLVGDHLYVGGGPGGSAKRLVDTASAEACSVSAVQVTRESLLPRYGTVGGRQRPGKSGLYQIDTVIEKPTPTEAENRLIVPGLRSGQYLCFFGMHVFTPTIFEILETLHIDLPPRSVNLSDALAELARREQYLAMVQHGRRFDVGVRYGLFTAQLAMALSGDHREEVLSEIVDLLATRELLSRKEVVS